MATRAIHTVFTVGGENTYRDAVKRINAQIKELNSELELTKERFAGQEDSYTALFTKQQQMERLYQAQNDLAQTYAARLKQIQDNTNTLNEYSEDLRDTLNQIQAAMHNTSETSTGYDDLAREAREVEDELRAVETQMGKNATKSAELETGINKAQTEMERLARELSDIDPLVDEAASSMDGLAHSMTETSEEAEELREKGAAALDALASSELMDRARDGFREIVGAMQECIDKYIEFESAVAGVEKTVDATDSQMEILTAGIRDMAKEIPASTTEIASVAEAAGQLGIATEDILAFTEVMIKLGTSTNMSAEEAADSLARFANITQMDPSSFEKLGSAIVALGNSSAATETEIVEMATRLAATGELVGLSEPEILGMAAALSSLGIEAEAGGTAASKLFKKLESAVLAYEPALSAIEKTGVSIRDLELLEANQSKVFKETADSIGLTSTELSKYMDNVKLLEQISVISGTTAKDFVRAWGDDAVSALDLFITGLGRMDESGGNAVSALNEIAGFTEVRLSNAILALASSGGLLTETLTTADTAWEENAALAEEAAKRYETTESKVQILKNTVDDLVISVGEDFMAVGDPALELLTDIASAAAEGAESSPALASGLAGVGGALGGLTALTTAAGGIKLVSSALGIFGTMAGPVGIGVAALAGLGSAAAVYMANANQISAEAQTLIDTNDRLVDSAENANEEWEALNLDSDAKQKQVQSLIDRVTELSDTVHKTPSDKAVIESVVSELNALLPGLGLTFDEQTEKINLTRDAMLDFAEASLEAAKMDAAKQYIADMTAKQGDLQFQYDLTTAALEENAKAQGEMAGKFREVNTAFEEGSIGYFEWLQLQNELKTEQAGLIREEDELRSSQEELTAAIRETNDALDEARGAYDRYMDSLDGTTRYTEGMAETIGKLYDQLVSDAQTAHDEQVSAAEAAAQEELDTYAAGLDAQIDALDDKHRAETRALEKQNREELRTYKKQQEDLQDALDEALDAEMDALEAQYDEKKKLIDAEYTERLKLIDEDKYNALMDIDEQIAAIEALTEAEEKALEEQKQAEEIAAAEKAVRDAETREEREKAEKELADLLADIERDKILAERDAQIKGLEEEKKLLEEEYKAKAEEVEAEKKAALEAVDAEYKEEKTLLSQQHSEKRELLKQKLSDELYDFQQGQSDKLTALRDAQTLEKTEAQAHRDSQVEAERLRLETELTMTKQNAADKLEEAKKNAEDMLKVWEGYRTKFIKLLNTDKEAESAGKSVGQNFAWGIELGLSDTEEEVTFAAKRLARGALLNGMQEELDMHSPSRKAKQFGNWFGDGLVIGLEEKVAAVQSAVGRLSSVMNVSGTVSSSAEAERSGGFGYSGGGGVLGSAGSVVNYYNVTIPASDIREFNDIVRIAGQKRQQIRMAAVEG